MYTFKALVETNKKVPSEHLLGSPAAVVTLVHVHAERWVRQLLFCDAHTQTIHWSFFVLGRFLLYITFVIWQLCSFVLQ